MRSLRSSSYAAAFILATDSPLVMGEGASFAADAAFVCNRGGVDTGEGDAGLCCCSVSSRRDVQPSAEVVAGVDGTRRSLFCGAASSLGLRSRACGRVGVGRASDMWTWRFRYSNERFASQAYRALFSLGTDEVASPTFDVDSSPAYSAGGRGARC